MLEKKNGTFYEYNKNKKVRLIVGYSETRAKKDSYNRDKGLWRLEKEYKSGNITKDKINFLEISDNVDVSINYEKVREDEKWDGLKGYITNTSLPAQTVYEEYRGLWQVERAFSNFERAARTATDVSFYKKTDRGAYLHLLHSLQGLQRTRAGSGTQRHRTKCRQSSEYSQNHRDHQS